MKRTNEEVGDHADDRGTLGIADGVKDLVDLSTAVDLDLDGVRALKTVEILSTSNIVVDKLRPDAPLREQNVDLLIMMEKDRV